MTGRAKTVKALEYYQGDNVIYCPNWDNSEGINNCFGTSGISQEHLMQMEPQGCATHYQNKACVVQDILWMQQITDLNLVNIT